MITMKRNGQKAFMAGLVLWGLVCVGGAGRGWPQAVKSTPVPVPVATPMPEPTDPKEWLEWMQCQETAETFWISEYEMPNGDTRLAERVIQVPGAGCGVVSTRGYIACPDGRGYWNQGFVENEILEVRRGILEWFAGLIETEAIAAQIKKVKPSHKFQAKLEKPPKKLKKIKWKKAQEIIWSTTQEPSK